MKKVNKSILLLVAILVIVGCSNDENSSLSQNQNVDTLDGNTDFNCEYGSKAEGKIVDVVGTKNILYSVPKDKSTAIINEKASKALGETYYQLIDSSTKVQLQCRYEDWAKVRITEPDYLDTVVGWTLATSLAIPLKNGEFRTFTENDIYWDEHTKNYKAQIVKAINRIHRENELCRKNIDTSVSQSPTKSLPNKPMFFLACGSGLDVANVFFTLDDVGSDKPMSAVKHISQKVAVNECEAYAKLNSQNPSTVSFSRLSHLNVKETNNGRTRVTSKFTAKNLLNAEAEFNIDCLFDANGMIESVITENK